jgi:glutaryl-CoA dehydrogenase
MATDLYTHPDYYNLDDLYSEEHKLVRDAARAWVKKEVSPIIDEHYEKATFPNHLLAGLGRNWCFWSLYS